MTKAAILSQLESARRRMQKKEDRDRHRELLKEGTAAHIKLPPEAYGNKNALGIANAEQQLVAALIRDPALIEMAQSRIRPEQFLMPDMKQAYEEILACRQQGINPEIAQLGRKLPEETISTISSILARNYDVGLGKKDVEMYLDRMEQSAPKSTKAASMSEEDLAAYMESLRRKKQ